MTGFFRRLLRGLAWSAAALALGAGLAALQRPLAR